jgi:DNA polymerase III alpha subunit
MMMSFSGYSFCKPHSASYARVSFQAAYLKTHHPAEFMAAVISNQGGFYSTFAYVSEARRLGMEFLTFEDETGIVETTFFPENTYNRFCHMHGLGHPYLLYGKVEEEWGAITLTVDRVKPPIHLNLLTIVLLRRYDWVSFPSRRREGHHLPDACERIHLPDPMYREPSSHEGSQ